MGRRKNITPAKNIYNNRMKKVIIILTAIAIAIIYVQYNNIAALKMEKERYKHNTETILQDVKFYKTKNETNAAKVGVLELELSEYKKYRESDAELIKSLQLKNRELQNVTSAQMETISKLSGNVHDSIVYLPGDTTVLECVNISDPWFSFNGCKTKDGEFSGVFVNRDSICIVATVEYKRFLGFLWRTKKVKNREIDIVSKNPHTKIIGVEYIEIEK